MTTSVSVHEGHIDFRGHRTWYRVTGDLRGDRAPVVVVHGGPGSTHDSVLSFTDLAADDRAVIHYDQIGNGRSSRVPDAPEEFWRVERFRDELVALLAELGVEDRYHLLGHSWGGMLSAEHAVHGPSGMRSLVLVSAPASVDLGVAEQRRLYERQPEAIQKALGSHAATRSDSPEYELLQREYFGKHLCRVTPWPDELVRSLDAGTQDPTVLRATYGPRMGEVTGTLRGWSVVDRLEGITAPTLLLSGSYDHVAPAAMLPFHQRVRDVRWAVLPDSGHFPHIDERELCMRFVAEFLASHD